MSQNYVIGNKQFLILESPQMAMESISTEASCTRAHRIQNWLHSSPDAHSARAQLEYLRKGGSSSIKRRNFS